VGTGEHIELAKQGYLSTSGLMHWYFRAGSFAFDPCARALCASLLARTGWAYLGHHLAEEIFQRHRHAAQYTVRQPL
jgi:hypothetical protein